MTVSRRQFLMQAVAACALPQLGRGATAKAQLDVNRVALLADTHVLPGKEITKQHANLVRTIKDVLAMRPLPANVIIYGDLAYLVGNPAEYELLKELLAPLLAAGITWHPVMGNHDRRRAFYNVFPEMRARSSVRGKVASVVELPHADFILLDSCLAPDHASGDRWLTEGGLDDKQLEWLRGILRKQEKPVFLGAHHSLNEVLNGYELLQYPAVAGFIHGHNHYWRLEGEFPGLPQLCLPSTGHNGDIGHAVVDLTPAAAAFTLTQYDSYSLRDPINKDNAEAEKREHTAKNNGAKWQLKWSPKNRVWERGA